MDEATCAPTESSATASQRTSQALTKGVGIRPAGEVEVHAFSQLTK